jgi:hypothetical protein
MKKSKQELIEEAAKLARAHQDKKVAIEKIFSELDKEDKMSQKHLAGIAAVNDILKEMNLLEQQHEKILEEIKGN